MQQPTATATFDGKKIVVTKISFGGYQVENYEDLAKLKKPVEKIVYMLPSKFKVEGLPYHLEFTLDIVRPKDYPKHGATFQITEFTRKQKSPAGLTRPDLDMPINLLRSLAIKASTVVALCTPVGYTKNGVEYLTQINPIRQTKPNSDTLRDFLGTLKGEDLYKALGEVWRNASHGSIYKDIGERFGFGDDWANKHIYKGKKKYPQYFKKPKATTATKAKGKK